MIKKLINEFLDSCMIECKKDVNRKKIEDSLLNPMIEFIIEKIKPYILITCIFLVTIILMIISIILLIILK